VNLSEFFLGLIAVAVLAMAGLQVWAVIFAARTARRLGEMVSKLEQDVRPIVANVQAMSADAARAAAIATAQVERAERLLNDASRRVEETMTIVQQKILGPARDGMAIVQAVKTLFTAFRDLRARSRRQPPSPGRVPVAVPDPGADDDSASFIG
jgi:outer membrane murein-binding lipoprotein Lpp